MIKPFICIASIGLACLFDQLTKLVAVTNLANLHRSVEVIPGLLDFVFVKNFGAAFGVMKNSTIIFIIFTVFLVGALGFILFRFKKHNVLSYIAISAIIAGGIGNFIDRIVNTDGYVVDFIHISFFPPVFNVADIFVTCGVALLVIYMFVFAKDDKENKSENEGKRLKS